MQETLSLLLANNKGADQPAHRRSLISAFIIRYQKITVTLILHFGGLQHDIASGYAPGMDITGKISAIYTRYQH